jgi:hypothetical protein
MAVRTRSAHERLQDVLERLKPGDSIQITNVSHDTGVDAPMCEAVLDALTKVGLFTRTTDQMYVRRRMLGTLDDLESRQSP